MSASPSLPLSEKKILVRSAIAAFFIEAFILTAMGWENHWMVHPQKTTGLDDAKFLQTEMYQMPEKPVLTAEKPARVSVSHEVAISKEVGKGRTSKANEKPIQESNQVQQGDAGQSSSPTHGPVAVFTPTPVIPSYLQNRDLNAAVVIEFLISGQGAVTPRLLSSSGSEELDAIAISTAKKWQFRPAEQDHKPVDAKVRLKIVFEVK